jgi:hypothetical protein
VHVQHNGDRQGRLFYLGHCYIEVTDRSGRGFSSRKGYLIKFSYVVSSDAVFFSCPSPADVRVLCSRLERIAAKLHRCASVCQGATQSARSFRDIRFS